MRQVRLLAVVAALALFAATADAQSPLCDYGGQDLKPKVPGSTVVLGYNSPSRYMTETCFGVSINAGTLQWGATLGINNATEPELAVHCSVNQFSGASIIVGHVGTHYGSWSAGDTSENVKYTCPFMGYFGYSMLMTNLPAMWQQFGSISNGTSEPVITGRMERWTEGAAPRQDQLDMTSPLAASKSPFDNCNSNVTSTTIPALKLVNRPVMYWSNTWGTNLDITCLQAYTSNPYVFQLYAACTEDSATTTEDAYTMLGQLPTHVVSNSTLSFVCPYNGYFALIARVYGGPSGVTINVAAQATIS